jgi:hypothetical protein
MATVMRLGIDAEALAALGARLRADVDRVELDREVAAGLDEVVDRLGVDVAAMTPEERRRIAMSAQALLLQAADVLGDPGRPPGWAFDDAAILLSTGRLSAGIAGDIAEDRAGARRPAGRAAARRRRCYSTWARASRRSRVRSARRGPDSGSSLWSPGVRRLRRQKVRSVRATPAIASSFEPPASKISRTTLRSMPPGWPAPSCRRPSCRWHSRACVGGLARLPRSRRPAPRRRRRRRRAGDGRSPRL